MINMTQITLEKTNNFLILKIPLKSIDDGRVDISKKDMNIIDNAISEGLADIEAGRVFGPFASVEEAEKGLLK